MTVEILGMECENCVRAVEQAVAALPGIVHVDVVLRTGQAVVEHASDWAGLEKLREAVEGAGFDIAKR